MRSAFVKINEVPTRVTCWGKWIEESFQEGDCMDIVLMIAGNPGITGYYEKFLETIHQETGYNVWILSHAGHETPEPPTVLEMPQLEGNHNMYNLKGQVDHKHAFIKQYVPANARLHLLGHSIGAYMCTNLLDIPLLNERIHKAYLLFPTLERMAISPNGQFYVKIVRRLQAILMFLACVFALLPRVIRAAAASVLLYMMGTNTGNLFVQPMLTLASPNVARMVMFLADDEMERVTERNDALIAAHQKKIFAYYGQTDGWAPIKYCEELRRDIPGVQVEVAREEFEHAYVLKHSWQMGVVVSELIKTN